MPQEKKGSNAQCRIHDKVGIWEFEAIRENVCVKESDYPLQNTDGKYYCLFHLPTEEKDIDRFEEIFQTRLNSIKEKFAVVEELPEQEREKAKSALSYNFDYVWFPSGIYLREYNFLAVANFSSAIFSNGADFSSATFLSDAYFGSATFSAGTSFRSATFSSDVYFNSTTFSSYVNFNLVTFSSYVDFNLVTFSSYVDFNQTKFSKNVYFKWAIFLFEADFSSATFSAGAYFTSTKFGKESVVNFNEANFEKDAFFDRTRFRNDVSFNSAILGSESYVIFRGAFFARKADFLYCTAEGYLIFTTLRQGRESSFDLQNAAFEKATRVSFHTIDLCPGWFVNVDSRKFVFTDIFWKHLDWDSRNKNLELELASLDARGIKNQRKRLLEIAARQLAVNAEENNRYEEAAKFRYMAMETKRLEETKHRSSSRYLFWLYKWSSGYGESWTRAALVLFVVIVFFGILYALPLSSFVYDEKQLHAMNVGEGLVHSLNITAFQRPDRKPPIL